MEKENFMITLKKIKVSFTKITLTLLSLLALISQVEAAPQAFSSELQEHIQNSAQKAGNKMGEAKSRLEALGTDTIPNIQRHAYSGGVSYSTFYLNSLTDLFRDIIPNFISCAAPKIVGLCIKKKGIFGITDIKPKWSYHFPTEVIEIVREKGLSAYVPDSYNFLLGFSENVEYGFAAENTQSTSYLTYLSSMVELRRRFPNMDMGDLFDEGDFEVSQDILDKLDEIKDAFPEELRLSVRTKGKAGVNNEYHVLPSLASVWLHKYYKYIGYFTGLPPELFLPCHDFPAWGTPYMSEWPYPQSSAQAGMTPLSVSRIMALTTKISAKGPNREYGQNMVDFLSSPLACMQDNTHLDTKVDLIFPGLKKQDHTGGKGGCYKDINLQNRLISLKASSPDKYHTSAAETAAAKGMHIAYDMFPENFYDFDMMENKIQWTRPDSMPSGCKYLSQEANAAQQYGAANQDTRTAKGLDADLKTLFKYRKFECCPSGYQSFPPNDTKL